jgi:(p)ppGpp synthase/HD superfamily hydrolase
MTHSPQTQLSDRFVQAVAFAADVHRTQSRKGTRVPYLAHLLAVASLVLEDGGDEDEAIAGLLHDAVEDSTEPMDAMLTRIRESFGERVADIVDACTDVDVTDTADRSARAWSVRKQHTIDALADADPGTARVMLADKLHNLRSVLTDLQEVGPRVWERFNAGREDQLWYYTALAEAARRRSDGRLASELARTVEHLEQTAFRPSEPRQPSD